jgi:hypothetical protein
MYGVADTDLRGLIHLQDVDVETPSGSVLDHGVSAVVRRACSSRGGAICERSAFDLTRWSDLDQRLSWANERHPLLVAARPTVSAIAQGCACCANRPFVD